MVKIHTAYYNDDGVLITQPVACALHYFRYVQLCLTITLEFIGCIFCRTNFFLDMVSGFPTDIVILLSWAHNIGEISYSVLHMTY